MILDSTNYSGVSQLRPGQFAVPMFKQEFNTALPDTPRLASSIGGMTTLLRNREFDEIVETFEALPGETTSQRLSALERLIGDEIASSQVNAEEQALSRIFHLIQLWGGKSGRNIYVMGGGYAENYNVSAYRSMIQVAISGRPVPDAVSAAGQISHFGISFATKHLRYWSLFAGDGSFAIYDKLMARGCMGHNQPSWSHYDRYLQELAVAASALETTVNQLERSCFGFFDSLEGHQWIKLRVTNN
ncbi:MAG: hypothetical protein KDN18_25510 [Verrucomicrobiae bacterium]|nr:hypothetical protein [Verrucomicrobiae bacterium]